VNGLNNFQIGFLTFAPSEGSLVDVNSYDVCAAVEIGVDIGLLITLTCPASSTQYRYVIVQSLDTSAEQLCIAEVCVYEGGQYVIMFTVMCNRAEIRALHIANFL